MRFRRWVFSSYPFAENSTNFPLTFLRRAGSPLLASLFPDSCRVCDAPLSEFGSAPVCASCLSTPTPLETEYCCARCNAPFLNERPLNEERLCRLCERGITQFESSYSFGVYEGTLRELIHLFKYHRMRSLGGELGRMMLRAYPRNEAFDAVVPMPLHWRRRLVRGYNQCSILSRVISEQTGLPVLAALRRRKNTRAQAGLTGAQRRANLRGAFSVVEGSRVRGKRLLLIDDVFTTGTTANSASALLKRAGAASVSILTLARTDRLSGIPVRLLDQAGDHR
jgi:ComF family protein